MAAVVYARILDYFVDDSSKALRDMKINSKAGQILGYSFLVVFENDHIIDAEELKLMKQLALEDRIVDEDEKNVLQHIFDRPNPKEMSIEVRADIRAFRDKYGI